MKKLITLDSNNIESYTDVICFNGNAIPDLEYHKPLNILEFLLELKETVKNTPNDQELGAKIRKLWN